LCHCCIKNSGSNSSKPCIVQQSTTSVFSFKCSKVSRSRGPFGHVIFHCILHFLQILPFTLGSKIHSKSYTHEVITSCGPLIQAEFLIVGNKVGSLFQSLCKTPRGSFSDKAIFKNTAAPVFRNHNYVSNKLVHCFIIDVYFLSANKQMNTSAAGFSNKSLVQFLRSTIRTKALKECILFSCGHFLTCQHNICSMLIWLVGIDPGKVITKNVTQEADYPVSRPNRSLRGFKGIRNWIEH